MEKAIDAQSVAIAAEVDAQATRPPVDRQLTREEFEPVQAKYVRLRALGSESNPARPAGYTIDEFEVWTDEPDAHNVALSSAGAMATGASRVAKDFADAYSPALTIDGKFGARWIAAGPELTIRLAKSERICAVTFSSDRNGDAGEHGVANFVADFQLLVSLNGQDWQVVADSHERRPVNEAHRQQRLRDVAITPDQRVLVDEYRQQLAEIDAQIDTVPPLDEWWAGQFQPANGPFHVFLGGDPQRPGPQVTPASLQVVGGPSAYRLEAGSPESLRRRQLAEWIVHPDNPLTARVLANRVWQYHFGTGIVATPSDFGAMGQRPTHPELLDFLASTLQINGWRLKPLHRLIMLSQTYRQSTEFRATAASRDGDARFLWRFPPRRLAAEEIRDTILSVAGKLDRRMYGPGFRLYRYLQDNVATYIPLDEHGQETYRRAVYHQNARGANGFNDRFRLPGSGLRLSAPRRHNDAAAGARDAEPRIHVGHGRCACLPYPGSRGNAGRAGAVRLPVDVWASAIGPGVTGGIGFDRPLWPEGILSCAA